MSADTDHKVSDSEGTVDKRVKDRIINARERVDDAEYKLYIEAPLEHNQTGEDWEARAHQAWGKVVKQYLRTIEPLLRDDEIQNAREVYESKDLGRIEIQPPNQHGIPFREFAASDMEAMQFRMNNELPADMELPTAEVVQFEGLESIIKSPSTITKTWRLNVGMYKSPEEGGTLTLTTEAVVPKTIYERALREADEFLQQAGVGLRIEHDRGDAGFSYGDLTEEGRPHEQ
jgi:hypothetical protein